MLYDNLHNAYCEQLKLIYREPQFICSPRGFLTYERLNQNFAIANPVQRACYLAVRKPNIIFNFSEILWYLSASDRLDFIGYYASSMYEYTMDNVSLPGTAYGPKIFSFGSSLINQWNRVVDILQHEDTESKRAFIQIFDPQEDLSLNNKDVSCTIGLQFFVRNQKLYLSTFMRANDAYRGLLSDIFSFTFLQELMARQLNLELGYYYHNVGSIHIYHDDEPAVIRIMENLTANPSLANTTYDFPELPAGNHWQFIETVLEIEEKIRKQQNILSLNNIQSLVLPDYWKQVIVLLNIYTMIKNHSEIPMSYIQCLHPSYQFLVSNKWPSNIKLA